MALFHRERSGEGQQVQVPMFETMLSFNLVEHLWTGAFDVPQGELGYDRVLMPDRKPFPTKDGYICLMATSDVQWQRLLVALDRPEVALDERFATLARRSSHFPQLYAIVADELKKHSTAEWQARLDKADIPNGPARMLSELPSDPYLVELRLPFHGRRFFSSSATMAYHSEGAMNAGRASRSAHPARPLAGQTRRANVATEHRSSP